MGNADLRDLAALEPIDRSALAGTVLAIDAHNWLYRYLTTTVKFTASSVYTTDGEEVANLIGIVTGVASLLEDDITPVFTFDGGASDLKEAELADRRERREAAEERRQAATDRGDAIEAARLEAQTQRLTETIQETSRELLRLLDLPIIEAPGAGEAQAAHVVSSEDADHVGSEDYDALLFGSPSTIRRLTGGADPERMDLAATLDRHDLTREQLIDVAILCGTDYNDGVDGVGPATAVEGVREHGDLWSVLDDRRAHIDHADRIRDLFRSPTVTDDYAIDTAIDPDLGAARQYVTETWEIPAEEVASDFERIETATRQTGLDQWS